MCKVASAVTCMAESIQTLCCSRSRQENGEKRIHLGPTALKVWKGGGGKSPAVVLHVATPKFKFGPEIFPRISQLRKFL